MIIVDEVPEYYEICDYNLVFYIILYILGYIPVHSWLFLYILVLIQDNYLLGFYMEFEV